MWLASGAADQRERSSYARDVYAAMERRGALFFSEIVSESGLLATQVEQALGELVALGLVTSDSFGGLRALLIPSSKRRPLAPSRRRRRTAPLGVENAGRWALLGRRAGTTDARRVDEAAVEQQARVLLLRYGVVFRRLLARETNLVPWRELVFVYRRFEARGEIRGGRFVAAMSGEQFALPEAVGQLRAVRRSAREGQLIGLSAADPLNLAGVVTAGERVPALATNRVVYQDGVPIAALEAGEFRPLAPYDAAREQEIRRALVRRPLSPALRAYVGAAVGR